MTRLLDFDTPKLTVLLSAAAADAVRQAARAVAYAGGALIYSRGDARPGLSLVRTGAVQIGNPGADGSFVTTSVLGPGQCFGEMTLFGRLPRTHDSVAVGATVIDQLSPAGYRAVSQAYPELNEALMTMMARRIHALLEFSDDLRRLPLIVQLAKTLLRMARGGAGDTVVEANQEAMAATLGVSRVAIGTALAALEDQALIKRGYGRVTIRDGKMLQQWVAARTMLAPIEGIA
ncbi:MAG: Crp/Fnr family transcriptional regulator [Sphingomonas sp.]|nr:Crp/Fnr family transcriptional regulator [Sphingomonas sp.]